MSTPAVVPTPIKTSTYCTEDNGSWTVKSEYSALGISECCKREECKTNGDYWVGAMKMCHDQGMRLPTEAELTQLATYYLYNTEVASTGQTDATLDTTKIQSVLSGLGVSWFYLWSSAESWANQSYVRWFGWKATASDIKWRYISSFRVFCVADE